MDFSTELKKIEEKYKEDCDKLKAKFDDDVAKLRSQMCSKQFPNIFNPKCGEVYYALTENGWVEPFEWSDCSYEQDVYRRGLAFTSKKEADFEDDCRLVRFELESFVATNDPHPITEKDWENGANSIDKYSMLFNHITNKIIISDVLFLRGSNQVYASNPNVIKKAIKHIGEERLKKYYFKIKN